MCYCTARNQFMYDELARRNFITPLLFQSPFGSLSLVMDTKHNPDPQLTGKEDLGKGSDTILIIEDDRRLRRLINQCLNSEGYTTLEARNPRAAIGIFKKLGKTVDLILTDILMPGMNGKDLTKRLIEHNASVDILFMSGHLDLASVHLSPEEFRDRFIQKPFRLKDLVKKVDQILKKKKHTY
jgi:DNA-binding NtrC family response regulator